MSAKKKTIVITMGKRKGQEVTLTRKKSKPDFVTVKTETGEEIQIHNSFLK
jgi:hypothetical protein